MNHGKKAIATFGLFIFPVFQSLAITSGIIAWLDWHWLLAGLAGFALGYIPGLGSILAIFGAIHGWGWSTPVALIFLIGIIPFVLIPFMED